MTSQEETTDVCCPKFDPIPWDDKTFEMENKKFIKEHVFTLFYMPVNFGAVMKRLYKRFTSAGEKMPDTLCLSDHTSLWNMDIYLPVEKEIPDIENTKLTGKFYSKVFEGPYKDSGKWMKEMEGIMKSKGMTSMKNYVWYTTCPKCAKKYGKNYVAMINQIG
ncbi:MAG: hypothetical protein Q8908_12185 [Bacteroidota bacterium]|nr:hypothetical protein [Bacteroidota bacterium]